MQKKNYKLNNKSFSDINYVVWVHLELGIIL